MNARQRCRKRRQMRYRDQCRIRQLRLNIIRTADENKCSTEEIIDEVWNEYPAKDNDLINFIIKFKNKLSDYPSSSIDNRCLLKNYIYSVKNRYHRRRRRDCFTSSEEIYVKFWEITAFCPLCKSVFRAIKAKQHLNNEHPEATSEQRSAVHRLAKFSLITCKPQKKDSKKIITNATDVLMQNKHRQKYIVTVSGGAFGQGK